MLLHRRSEIDPKGAHNLADALQYNTVKFHLYQPMQTLTNRWLYANKIDHEEAQYFKKT